MPDVTSAMARLLSDPALRARFRTDRVGVAAELCADSAVRSQLAAVDVQQLDEQAACLVDKRFHEVSKLLPDTICALGRNARGLFDDYASTAWPAGHRRHPLDASSFCGFLRRQGVMPVGTEAARVHVLSGRRRIAFALEHDRMTDGSRHAVVHMFIRFRGRVYHTSHVLLRGRR